MRNPHEIYRDVYFMVTNLGFTAEYIENISPAERGIYMSYYKQDQQSKQGAKNADALNELGLTMGDLR